MPELRLHETRVHTLDKAEGREMKLKERLAKMERDAESARKDNATVRKAVELLGGPERESREGGFGGVHLPLRKAVREEGPSGRPRGRPTCLSLH